MIKTPSYIYTCAFRNYHYARVCSVYSTAELQRSVEFEDSLTLLRSNKIKSSVEENRAFRTVGPGRRQWPPLNSLIDYFQSAKPAHDIVRGMACVHIMCIHTHMHFVTTIVS